MELNFKLFLESAELSESSFMSDVKETLLKIPKSHAKLVKSYQFTPEKGNTLSGDKGHIGEIDEKNKKIKVAAPWNYGREYTILHEVGHAVFKYKMDAALKSKWNNLVKKAKKKYKGIKDNNEELFCMVYAQHYARNKLVKYDFPDLLKFIPDLPK